MTEQVPTRELYDLARRVGLEAAAYVRSARPAGRVDVASTKSSDTDVVTEIDEACERLIRERIFAARPDDGFVGEEGDDVIGSTGVDWVVDPIDGTVNFVYGIPMYAVSIAARHDGEIVVGHVVNIASGAEWGAVAGEGAWCHEGDDRRVLAAPTVARLSHALVATGFNYVPEVRAKQAAAMARFIPQVRDIRRIGSAALDLCALAEGQFDAYVEQGLKPWDLAAGGLVAREAGIVLSGLDGGPDERLVMGAHPAIAEEYFALVRACGF
ncbi:inositol monophosphatase family protein [Aeromicrobium fastidiosum]|uniref:Inositol-1-monophosphatase n=1 Tax=Aeromicrobium fastidiosum TaxID=52699 RepID=A0A641AKN1_9ACTN|nr:inositol monophosphatase family protein [Aeromicrobium fastidiosum]KAA1375923.1 inositol monophosphatase [Aeromicrobium fastidiosum]MBP2392223.1 myo-inositol-1(or 4)-monophosphatase [Aeromicrobium fastidiosum]